MIATPFVQGRLRKEHLSVKVRTRCAHCDEVLNMEIDSDLDITVREDTAPMVFLPEVNVFALEDKNIIDAF